MTHIYLQLTDYGKAVSVVGEYPLSTSEIERISEAVKAFIDDNEEYTVLPYPLVIEDLRTTQDENANGYKKNPPKYKPDGERVGSNS